MINTRLSKKLIIVGCLVAVVLAVIPFLPNPDKGDMRRVGLATPLHSDNPTLDKGDMRRVR